MPVPVLSSSTIIDLVFAPTTRPGNNHLQLVVKMSAYEIDPQRLLRLIGDHRMRYSHSFSPHRLMADMQEVGDILEGMAVGDC